MPRHSTARHPRELLLAHLGLWLLLPILGLTVAAVCGHPVCAQEPATASLPLSKVVLFNSGVGFFEHYSEVEGDAQVDLKFNVENINDLLKSMVLQDGGGGRIAPITYGSKDPITKTLKTFAIDLTTNPTLGQLLDQIRGEQVRIESPNPVVGTILGIERRKQQVGQDDVVETEHINLLTDEGLRSLPLATVQRIKLSNEKLDAELRQALLVLSLGHSTDKKTVTLNFLGQGKRPVRVGYIQEAPIWKTSYRLVLKDDETPFLQGWAIVENTTEEDWKEVDLTLVSGRPISFVMNLYDPLYIARPLVEPELFASLRPQTYGQDLAQAEQEFRDKDKAADAKPGADAREEQLGEGKGGGALRRNRGAAPAEKKRALADDVLNLASGVQSAAQALEVGELFQYRIDAPVTLPRQQSAMLPIVNDSVKGEKVSIYNPTVHPKHPLNGLKMTNSTGLHLMQGPITVFDGGTYAGDAQIENLAPGSERLISYAMDLDTEVAPESKGTPDRFVSCKLVKGTLHTVHRYQRSQLYTIKNSGSRAKKVLIEYPVEPNWTLTAPKEPEEKTRDRYRFAVQAEPGKPATLSVEEQYDAFEQIALGNLDQGTIEFFIASPISSQKVKDALAEVIQRKQALQEIVVQRQQCEQQITVVDQEQARIRQNMAQLDRTSELYIRYVKKFGEQEDEVESLRGQIAELVATETRLRQALDEYLIGLEVE